MCSSREDDLSTGVSDVASSNVNFGVGEPIIERRADRNSIPEQPYVMKVTLRPCAGRNDVSKFGSRAVGEAIGVELVRK